jgi:prevent-host-death family protein
MAKKEATMPAGEFKARCLQIMETVARTRRPVTITKRGRAIARLVPVETEAESFLGSLRGRITIAGEVTGPTTPPDAWETEREWLELCRENPPR